MPSKSNTWSAFRRLLEYARDYRPHLVGLLLLSLASPLLKILSPLPLKLAVDSVVGNEPPPAIMEGVLSTLGVSSKSGILVFAVVFLVAVTFCALLMGLFSSLLSAYAGEKLTLAFRSALFGHSLRLSLSYHDSRGTTDSTYRIQYDAPAIRWILVDASIPLLMSAITLLAMVGIIAVINLQLAIVALAVAPILSILSRIYGQKVRDKSDKLKKLDSSALSIVQEVLSALRLVKASGQEEREQERFATKSSEGFGARFRLAFTSGLLALLVGLTTAAGTGAVLLIGISSVQAGTLTLGDLLVVMAYLAQLYGPMETLTTKVADLQGSILSAERCFVLMDQGPDVQDSVHAKPLARAAGAIEYRDVVFAYKEGRPVLHGISFAVSAGARVGIAGTTGAGKSTLMSLLTRFYDPTSGQILLDGVDLRDYRLADLRNQFSIVLQESVLFSASIAENIAYARPEATAEEIIAAAKAANAHDFISALPQGYETKVGERGLDMSGGERQRISLARAFLKNAPILILDEPTSAVDVKTEALIMEALERLMEGRTTFIIAHRLSTLENCDVRLQLEHGKLTSAPSAVYQETSH